MLLNQSLSRFFLFIGLSFVYRDTARCRGESGGNHNAWQRAVLLSLPQPINSQLQKAAVYASPHVSNTGFTVPLSSAESF